MTPSLLPEEMYDMDFFEGWDDVNDVPGTPILTITADTPKTPGGITSAFADGLAKATAFTVQELSKVSLGVAIHFTPPNGKTVTPLRAATGAKGVKALKRRIHADFLPLDSLSDNNAPRAKVPTAIPGGDPSDPTPVNIMFGSQKLRYIPQSVGGLSFVTPRGSTAGKNIRFTDPREIMRHGTFFTRARGKNWHRRKARQAYQGFPLWVKPAAVRSVISEQQKKAGTLLSGWQPAVRMLGYGNKNRADFHPNADGFANWILAPDGSPAFEFGNREFKNLNVSRIKKGLAERIMKWSEYGWEKIGQHLEKNYLKTLKAATGL